MSEQVLSPRYAKVLFDLDCKEDRLEQRLKDFAFILTILQDNPKLVKFLHSPQIAIKKKHELLQNSLKENFDNTFLTFLSYIVEKKRLSYLSAIGNKYRLLVNQYLERWEADIVTAVPMEAENEAKLVEKLESIFHKKVYLNKKIDPKIIGGVILLVSNEMLDWSVTGRLKKLREHLMTLQI